MVESSQYGILCPLSVIVTDGKYNFLLSLLRNEKLSYSFDVIDYCILSLSFNKPSKPFVTRTYTIFDTHFSVHLIELKLM